MFDGAEGPRPESQPLGWEILSLPEPRALPGGSLGCDGQCPGKDSSVTMPSIPRAAWTQPQCHEDSLSPHRPHWCRQLPWPRAPRAQALAGSFKALGEGPSGKARTGSPLSSSASSSLKHSAQSCLLFHHRPRFGFLCTSCCLSEPW